MEMNRTWQSFNIKVWKYLETMCGLTKGQKEITSCCLLTHYEKLSQCARICFKKTVYIITTYSKLAARNGLINTRLEMNIYSIWISCRLCKDCVFIIFCFKSLYVSNDSFCHLI